MADLNYIRKHLLGCLEVALFLPNGVKRFSDDNKSVLYSFAIPFLVLPLTLVIKYLLPTSGAEMPSLNAMTMLAVLRTAMIFLFFFGAVYGLAKHVDRLNHFKCFLVGTNWMCLFEAFLIIPLLVFYAQGTITLETLYALSVCIMIYTVAYTAYLATTAMRIPLELGGSIAIFGMMVNEMTGDLSSWVMGII